MFGLWISGENTRENKSSVITHTAGDRSSSVSAVGFALGSSAGTYDDIRHCAYKGKSSAHLGHVQGVHPGHRGDCSPHSRRNIAGNVRGVYTLCRQCGIFD